MLDVKRLRLLVELSRRGTIAAVAQALAYSPSAVSQQLAVLEKEAGVALLAPLGRRVRLTPQGELLVGHAETVLAELERAQAALDASTGDVVGTVRLAAFQSAVLSLVPGALHEVGHRHPGLRVEVTELEPELSLPALVAGDFDIVLGEEYPGHPQPRLRGADREDLLSDPMHLVLPAGWGRPRLGELADRPFAMEPEGTASRQWCVAVCREAGIEPDVRYTTTDLQLHLHLVDQGLAAALLPELAGTARAGVSVSRLPGDPRRGIFTSTRRGGRSRPAVRAVVEALRPAPAGSQRHRRGGAGGREG